MWVTLLLAPAFAQPARPVLSATPAQAGDLRFYPASEQLRVWTVTYADGSPVRSRALLELIDDPALTYRFTKQQDLRLGLGVGGAVVGQGLFISGLVLALNNSLDPEPFNDAGVIGGLVMMSGGLIVDYLTVVDVFKLLRRERRPSTWMEEDEARSRILFGRPLP
jgi:hypothetical protein